MRRGTLRAEYDVAEDVAEDVAGTQRLHKMGPKGKVRAKSVADVCARGCKRTECDVAGCSWMRGL